MLDIQTTETERAVSQSDRKTTISDILGFVLSEDLPSKPPVVDMSLYEAVQIIKLLPDIDVETAASYNWQRIPTSRDLDEQAVELENTLAILALILTRKPGHTLVCKVLDDSIVLRRRAMRVYTALWDIRFKSVKWGRRRIERTLDQECARLWWAFTRESDPELRHLLIRQIEQFKALAEEALAI